MFAQYQKTILFLSKRILVGTNEFDITSKKSVQFLHFQSDAIYSQKSIRN